LSDHSLATEKENPEKEKQMKQEDLENINDELCSRSPAVKKVKGDRQ